MSGLVVVDTNILVRAVLSGKGKEDAIIGKIGNEDWRLVYGEEQLEELIRVLGYRRIAKRYKWDKGSVDELVSWMIKYGREVRAVEVDICRDKNDNYVVGLAVRAARKTGVYLVTGDKDILDLKGKVGNVTIVTPGECLKVEVGARVM
ncbi:MAG: putative toxin-antitoxin system toxin component, PIN family [Patescibacteria group bacterium]